MAQSTKNKVCPGCSCMAGEYCPVYVQIHNRPAMVVVLLELPLNFISIIGIGKHVKHKIFRPAKA